MPRLTTIDPATATGKTKDLLETVQRAFGSTPNGVRALATSPALLEGWLALSTALSTTLTRQLREQIAIAISEQNGCAYCLSAHVAVGGMLGLGDDEVERNRAGDAADPMSAAALTFALAVNAKRGGVSDRDLARVRAAGFGDSDIVAIVGHVALNVLTNYVNHVALPVIDFPAVTPGLASAA